MTEKEECPFCKSESAHININFGYYKNHLCLMCGRTWRVESDLAKEYAEDHLLCPTPYTGGEGVVFKTTPIPDEIIENLNPYY